MACFHLLEDGRKSKTYDCLQTLRIAIAELGLSPATGCLGWKPIKAGFFMPLFRTMQSMQSDKPEAVVVLLGYRAECHDALADCEYGIDMTRPQGSGR